MKNLIDGLYLEGSTKPIIIDDQNICYHIIKGGADVFLTTRVNEGLTGAKQHLVHTDYDHGPRIQRRKVCPKKVRLFHGQGLSGK